MFSKPIFKQTLKSNYVLWIIFTVVLSVISTLFIAVYDPETFSSMTDMIADMGMADMVGDRLDNMTSLLGVLGTTFYDMLCSMLPMIYIIIVANSLIASQVDRGSMAYLLSTPIKRSKVVATQALFMILSLICMFVVITGVGLTTVQIFHGGVIGETYTEDVKAVASSLDMDRQDVADDLYLILDDEDALAEGAEARGIDEEIYELYLGLKINENAYRAAADELDVELEDVEANPGLILDDSNALAAAAAVMNMDEDAYEMYLQSVIAQQDELTEDMTDTQNQMLLGLTAAAEELDMEIDDLTNDLGLLESEDEAMAAAVAASGLPEEMFLSMINQGLATNELSLDDDVIFEMFDYLMLNLGIFLLLFAISSISFLASCIFNLSRNSLAIGAGIPVAFFVFQIIAQTSDSMENFKYLSLNTLFDSSEIISGGSYGIQFAVLGGIGIVLYAIGMRWFVKKDLPL